MTRKTKSESPSSGSASARDNPTIEQRVRYLTEQLGTDPGFLEQWIVHYLAEQLERAESDGASQKARKEARSEIAAVIPALWEQQTAREALAVRREVDFNLRRTDTLNEDVAQLLRPLLRDPSRVESLPASKLAEAFRGLHALSELVTRLLVSTSTAERSKRKRHPESSNYFLRRDEEVQGLRTRVALVLPQFASLDLTVTDVVFDALHQSLLAIAQAQLALLTRVVPDAEATSRRRSKSRRGSVG
ncbi:MAG TPA: hypothetical protein VF017_10970 [Thermoanaerobaculia bacterium]|nr:hypothetical protein [Thermoanaerobaculia bacterium]